MTEAKPPPPRRRAAGTKMSPPTKAKVAQRKTVKRPAKSGGRKQQPPPAPPVVARKPAPATPHPSTVQAKRAGPKRGAAAQRSAEKEEKKNTPSFAQLTDATGGKLLFFSNQSDILKFLQRVGFDDWGGMCAALVLMWLGQKSSKIAPNKGIKNKVEANELQRQMEGSWEGLDTVEKTGTKLLGNFWWKSKKRHAFVDFSDPAPFLQNDPKDGRDGLHVLVLYFEKGPAHAIGAWRFPPSGAMVLYDPNQGACAQSAKDFPKFLASFIEGIYGEGLAGWAVCSFWKKG